MAKGLNRVREDKPDRLVTSEVLEDVTGSENSVAVAYLNQSSGATEPRIVNEAGPIQLDEPDREIGYRLAHIRSKSLGHLMKRHRFHAQCDWPPSTKGEPPRNDAA